MLKKCSIILVILLLFLGLGNKVQADTPFSLDKESIDVKLNGTGVISFSGGTGSITWNSEDPSIATVENGIIRGKKIGETIVTATRGTETATCTVKVIYSSIQIGANQGTNASKISLILNEHNTENLFASVKDYSYNNIDNAKVNWKSSDNSIVTVDANGKINAIKSGTSTITAESTGVIDTCEVTVYEAPDFTDFKNAKYETNLDDNTETLKISGINPKDNSKNSYYYIITSNKTKPELVLSKNGSIDTESMKGKIEVLLANTEENYLYTRNLSKYEELKSDMYIWIIQEASLQEIYYDESGNIVSKATTFLTEAKQLDRTSLPPLNLILQSFNIGSFTGSTNIDDSKFTYLRFNFPTATENRKFNLKIGKITDNAILTKIKNNDYTGITDLLTYAKNNEFVYSSELTTFDRAYFKSDEVLFDGNKLLENNAYYYIYAQFDDENGKYYPIEGVTLGQAWKSTISDSWNLWAYTSKDFNWDNLTPTNVQPGDSTIVPGILPHTGVDLIIASSALILISILGIVFYKKYNNYKDVN